MLIRCDNILIRLVDKILIRFMNDRYMIDDSTMFSHLTSQVLPLVLRRRLAAACHDAQRRGQVGHLAFVQGEAAQLLLRQGANWVWLGNWGLSICLYMVIYGYIMLNMYAVQHPFTKSLRAVLKPLVVEISMEHAVGKPVGKAI